MPVSDTSQGITENRREVYHFIEEETEAKGKGGTCPGSHIQQAVKQDMSPRCGTVEPTILTPGVS